MTDGLLRARSVDELHLYLDLAGWRPERTHRLTVVGGQMQAVYRGHRADGAEVEAWFAPVPALPRTAPSALIDAAQWYRLATDLAQTVPAGQGGTHPAAQERLRQAVAYLEEVLRFVPDGAEALPASAFWSTDGRAAWEREPARFDVAMLDAEARTWRSLLVRAG